MNMLLRRSHPVTQDPRVLDPAHVPGTTDTTTGANAADLEPALAELEAARAATVAAQEALDAPDVTDPDALTAALEAARVVEQEAAAKVEAIQQGIDEAEAAATKHGDLERPTRGASTAVWVEYATADPHADTNGLDLTARTGLRDEIATHYLGAPE